MINNKLPGGAWSSKGAVQSLDFKYCYTVSVNLYTRCLIQHGKDSI